MSLYIYLKKHNRQRRKVINYFSYVTLTIGSLLLFWSFYPIISFEIYSKIFFQGKIYSPVPKSDSISFFNLNSSVLGSSDVRSSDLKDFTQASTWFPLKNTDGGLVMTEGKISTDSADVEKNLKEYFLSIPKLNIKNAKVSVGGDDLTKSLIHFLPKNMPGEYGNIVIFGHSTLPQLYNVRDYKTIFTFLPSLTNNDKIYLNVGDSEYEYEVYEMFVVEPDQISVLEQRADASYLTLITCVPPGTFWKRLVIRARLNQLSIN